MPRAERLHPKINNIWLQSLGAFGPVTVTYSWPHGFESASWAMSSGTIPAGVRAGALVQIMEGPRCIGSGRLLEPGSDGTLQAVGAWREAQSVPSVTTGIVPTTVPDTAVDAAIARGSVLWFRQSSISSTAWSNDPTSEVDVATLLDNYATGVGLRWYVDPDRHVRLAADPTTPSWQVPPSADVKGGLGTDESEYFNRLYGRYLSAENTISVAAAGNAVPEAVADLTGLGVIDSTRAQLEVQSRLLLAGERRGWAEGLTLARRQILNMGASLPGSLSSVAESVGRGAMVRLHGVTDLSRPKRVSNTQDVVIAEATYTDGEDEIQLKPMQMAPRNLTDVLKVAVEAE